MVLCCILRRRYRLARRCAAPMGGRAMTPTCTKCGEPWSDNQHRCQDELVARLKGSLLAEEEDHNKTMGEVERLLNRAERAEAERDALKADLIAADKDVASLKGERDALRAVVEAARALRMGVIGSAAAFDAALAKLEKR